MLALANKGEKMKTLYKGIILSLILSLNSVYADISPETMVNVFERLETLENKTRELNGENEMLKHQISELKKSQKQGFLSVDERIEEMSSSKDSEKKPEPAIKKEEPKEKPAEITKDTKPEKKETPKKIVTPESKAEVATKATTEITQASSTKEPAKKEASATATNTPKKKTRQPNSYERETYKSAFSLMKTSPTAATKAFQEYIKMQPESPLAANAQYWIGEIMYSHNNYKGAVQEFIKVLQKYKYSDKAPDAAIKLGYSFYALKNWAYAKRTFEDVVKYFPDNKNAIELANRRLAKIKAAGH